MNGWLQGSSFTANVFHCMKTLLLLLLLLLNAPFSYALLEVGVLVYVGLRSHMYANTALSTQKTNQYLHPYLSNTTHSKFNSRSKLEEITFISLFTNKKCTIVQIPTEQWDKGEYLRYYHAWDVAVKHVQITSFCILKKLSPLIILATPTHSSCFKYSNVLHHYKK